ncbi:MAG: calcium/sodium antiporter [Methanomicrobiaceae archaeon]|nr:calcium/sodium antiporter [Methanomicrobiaceae archaeon]
MILSIVLFVLGLALLIKGADYFVEGGGGLAARYGVSTTTIGFTVIAFGTSLPEFVVSVNAIATGNADIGLGNVVGSNIANLGLVLALCAVLKPAVVGERRGQTPLRHEALLMLAATAVFIGLSLRGVLDVSSGIVSLVVFAFLLNSLWKSGRTEDEPIVSHGNRDYAETVGGLIAVIIGSQLVLDGAVAIADAFGIPAYIIGLSMVAVGTSLPELVTSAVAILKGSGGISVGNILGSNIFNLLFVMGCGTLIRPVPIPNMVHLAIMGAFSLAVIPLIWGHGRMIRVWAALMIAGYAAYLGMIII